MWVEPKPIGINNHSRRSNIFSSDEKKYLGGPKTSLMHTICVVCCWRSNFRLVIVAPLAVKINAPGTPSSFKRGCYPACYNQPLLQPAPVSPILRILNTTFPLLMSQRLVLESNVSTSFPASSPRTPDYTNTDVVKMHAVLSFIGLRSLVGSCKYSAESMSVRLLEVRSCQFPHANIQCDYVFSAITSSLYKFEYISYQVNTAFNIAISSIMLKNHNGKNRVIIMKIPC